MLIRLSSDAVKVGAKVSAITQRGKRQCVVDGKVKSLTECGRFAQVEYSYRCRAGFQEWFKVEELLQRVSAREWRKMQK